MITEEDIDKAVLEAFKKVFPEHFGEEREWAPLNKKFIGNYEEEMNERPEGINKQKCA